MRTRIKFCGITRAADAQVAAQLGVDAIGLVFYAPSPRAVSIARAREIFSVLPPFVTRVGLFVDAARSDIERTLEEVPLDLLQFHGEESPETCASYGRAFIKAIRMRADIDLSAEAHRYERAAGLLLDTYRDGVQGGTGEVFDWSRVPALPSHAVILAGGLNPDNVRAAVLEVCPYAVDVSGGIESARGCKDAARMTAFVHAVERADHERRRESA